MEQSLLHFQIKLESVKKVIIMSEVDHSYKLEF